MVLNYALNFFVVFIASVSFKCVEIIISEKTVNVIIKVVVVNDD